MSLRKYDGTVQIDEVVENEINGVNLGIQFDNGQPVPLS